MEAEKSEHLPSENEDPGKVVVQFSLIPKEPLVQGLEKRAEILREMRCSTQWIGKKRTNSIFFCFLFYSGPQMGGCLRTSVILIYWIHHSNVNLIQKQPHRHTPRILLYLGILWPVKITLRLSSHKFLVVVVIVGCHWYHHFCLTQLSVLLSTLLKLLEGSSPILQTWRREADLWE